MQMGDTEMKLREKWLVGYSVTAQGSSVDPSFILSPLLGCVSLSHSFKLPKPWSPHPNMAILLLNSRCSYDIQWNVFCQFKTGIYHDQEQPSRVPRRGIWDGPWRRSKIETFERAGESRMFQFRGTLWRLKSVAILPTDTKKSTASPCPPISYPHSIILFVKLNIVIFINGS